MKCKIIFNPSSIPTFEDFEKIEKFEYDGVLELLERVYQPPGNICWVLNCENGKLYVSENGVFLELGIIKNYFEEKSKSVIEENCCDIMLDEVISSQHLEIERLMSIVRDLVITNTKLVEIIGNSK